MARAFEALQPLQDMGAESVGVLRPGDDACLFCVLFEGSVPPLQQLWLLPAPVPLFPFLAACQETGNRGAVSATASLLNPPPPLAPGLRGGGRGSGCVGLSIRLVCGCNARWFVQPL